MPAMPPASAPGAWPTHRTFTVTYHDLDVLNHLNHATYFPWMETLRCDYYLPLLRTADPSSLDIIVAEASCRYLAPVGYGVELLGEVAPARPLGRTSFVLLYRFSEVNDPHRVVARGRTVVVSFDYRANSKKEIPGPLRTRMETDGVDPATEGWSA
ncbi:MAG TPA: thioesterase family protein [Thermoplasmata archaeon]|nr:thioesterase family protein [Thermoplasmata archaeon]